VLVFEKLRLPQPQKGAVRGVSLRRRLALWQHGAIRRAAASKAQMGGLAVTEVEPAYTSQNCSRFGLRGVRKRHVYSCPYCGHTQHADLNAAVNIRSRFVQLRLDGASSVAPEALPVAGEGKLRALARSN
jgi:putative transposase